MTSWDRWQSKHRYTRHIVYTHFHAVGIRFCTKHKWISCSIHKISHYVFVNIPDSEKKNNPKSEHFWLQAFQIRNLLCHWVEKKGMLQTGYQLSNFEKINFPFVWKVERERFFLYWFTTQMLTTAEELGTQYRGLNTRVLTHFLPCTL